jgi:hypothetical protein
MEDESRTKGNEEMVDKAGFSFSGDGERELGEGEELGTEVAAEEEKGKGPELSASILSKAFTSQGLSSVLNSFTNPGQTVFGLEMRAHYRDWGHVNAVARHLAKCRHFEDKEAEEELLSHLAGGVAIDGHRMEMVKDAVIGQHWRGEAEFGMGLGDKLRKFFRLQGGEDDR